MDLESVNMNSTIRSRRTEILACSATDALSFIYSRDPGRNTQRVRILRVETDHADSPDRAVARTVAAAAPIPFDDAETAVHGSGTDMHGRLLLRGKRKYRSGRADLRAFRTFRTAIAVLVSHLRLH